MRTTYVFGIIMFAMVFLQGCAVGYNSVLFATKSNMGVDVDSTPPNFEVSISRQEGVIEPTFEGGQTVPVMASFSSKASSFTNFFWGVGSTFSTGEAAFTMSYLYSDDTPLKTEKIPYERVTLSAEPNPKLPFGIKANYLKPGEVLPVMFGTDTVLGLKVKWSGQTAQYPSSVNIGFKRKEMALAPIALATNRIKDTTNINNVNNKPLEADMPSLLATIDSGVAIPGTNAELTTLQYFATGTAASNLARQHAVREAMLKRADPGQDFQAYRNTVAGQVKEISTVLKCYAVAKQNDLPKIWQDASDKDLFFDKESLPKMLAWYKEASEKPEVQQENIRKSHKRYVAEISTSEGTNAERLAKLEAHEKYVCDMAKQ